MHLFVTDYTLRKILFPNGMVLLPCQVGLIANVKLHFYFMFLQDDTFVPERERELDMQHIPEDQYELQNDIQKIAEDEELERFYHPNQTYFAQVLLILRIIH